MRNLKKIIAVICVVAMLASMGLVTALAANTFETQATTLNNLGIMQGYGLTDSSNRLQGLIFAIRAAGNEKAALAMSDADVAAALANVVDAKDIPAWGQKYAAYAVSKVMTKGVGGVAAPAIKFAPLVKVHGTEFLVWLLQGMGYTTTTTATVLSDAVTAGVVTLSQAITFGGKELVRDDVAGMLWGAVSTGKAADGKKFIDTLVASGAVTAAAAQAAGLYTIAPTVLAVQSATALNLKEIVVNFNQEVDTDTVIVGNFTIGGANAGAVALSTDKKSVTVTVADAQWVNATQPKTYALVVKKDVKDLAGKTMAANFSADVRAVDTSLPTATKVELTGPNTFAITFSEPMQAAGTVKVNNGVYGVSVPVADGTNKATITLSASSLPEGNYTVVVAGYKDYAGFTIDSTTFTLAYVKDASAPTATIKADAAQKTVTVVFNKAVTLDNTNAAPYADYFYHTFSTWAPNSVAVNAAKTEYTLTFTTYPIPAGTTNLTIKAKGAAGVAIKDAWGNALSSNIVLPVTVTADVTAPTITKVETVDEKTVDVFFSEAMNQAKAEDETNFAVKDSAGKAVATTFTNTWDAANKKIRMVFASKLAGGAYTVDVKGQEDVALSVNALAAITISFTITDKTPIDGAVATDVVINGVESAVADTADVIYVTYGEKMATTGAYSVLLASNYLLAGAALPDGTTLELFGSTGKVVKISIPDGSKQVIIAAMLTIGRVADLAGNATVALSYAEAIGTEGAAVVTAVKVTDTNKVTIVVDKPLSVVLASGFTSGKLAPDVFEVAAIDSWSINDKNETVILATLSSSSALSATDTAEILLNFDVVGNILVSETGVKMAAVDYTAQVADYRVPTLIADDAATTTVNEAVVDVAGTDNAFDIKFREALDVTAGRAALMAQDLVIVKVAADGTKTTMVPGVDYTTTINAANNIRVTFAAAAAFKFEVSTRATINYIKDNSAQKNATPAITTPIEVTVVNGN